MIQSFNDSITQIPSSPLPVHNHRSRAVGRVVAFVALGDRAGGVNVGVQVIVRTGGQRQRDDELELEDLAGGVFQLQLERKRREVDVGRVGGGVGPGGEKDVDRTGRGDVADVVDGQGNDGLF